jgi:uncharacterized protein YdaU (DUF1376 family)
VNYYPFHIGDYLARGSHLSWAEDLSYRRMLDLYYKTESPLPSSAAEIAKLIGMPGEVESIEYVLGQFFIATNEGWRNSRCDKEIAAYYKAKANHWTAKLTKAERTAMENARRARKLNATPPWTTKEDRDAIAAVYAHAAMQTASTGVKHEVDHIVPLQGEKVCGLHVAWNLQVLTAERNRAKSNTWEVA